MKSWYWNNQMRFLECLKSAGQFLHGNNSLWSMMKKSSVSRMQRITYFQILCYVLETWIRTQHQILLLTPHLCLYLQKDFQQDVGHSSDLDQKRSGILLMIANHKENGTESQNWWWSNSVKADTQSSEPQVHCPEERSKPKEAENYQYTSVPWRYDWNCFSHNYFC